MLQIYLLGFWVLSFNIPEVQIKIRMIKGFEKIRYCEIFFGYYIKYVIWHSYAIYEQFRVYFGYPAIANLNHKNE